MTLLKCVRNKNYWRFIFSIIVSLPLITGISYNQGPAAPSCLERGDCSFFDAPFDEMLRPFTSTWGDYIYPAVWGLIIFVIWSRVENPFIPAIIGVALAAFISTSLISDEGRLIGYALLAMAIGIAVFQLITVKIHYPTN